LIISVYVANIAKFVLIQSSQTFEILFSLNKSNHLRTVAFWWRKSSKKTSFQAQKNTRFENKDVFERLEGVLEDIRGILKSKKSIKKQPSHTNQPT
jgi:hypothetical protein